MTVVELIPSNIEVLAFGIQTDKDTPATTPVIAIAIEDCSLDPGRQTDKEKQSDQTAQQGNIAVMGAQPGGTFKKYARPSEEDFFLYNLLGKVVESGTTPNFIHTENVDPAAPFSSPYLTCWDIWPGELCLRYDGMRLGSGHVMSQPGGFVEVEYATQALAATYLDPGAAPDLTGLFATDLALSWAELAISLGGVHSGVVNKLDLMIDRGTNRFPGDNGLNSLDVPNGLLAVTGSLDVAFTSDDLERAANTGSSTGTALTSAVFSEALSIALTRSANLSIVLSMLQASISNFKTPMNPDGTPAVSSFDFDSLRQATISDAIQAVVKNGQATADRS
jgi:hypothetical protein